MKRDSLTRKYKKEYEKAIEAIKQANLDPESYISHIPKPGKTRTYSNRELNLYLRQLEMVTQPGATDTITFKGSNIPKFYKDIYQSSKRRYNSNVPFLQRMNLNKFKEPSPDYSPFLEYSQKIIERSAPQYRKWREDIYKSNYLKAIKDTLYHTEKGKQLYRLIKGVEPKKLISEYNKKGNEDLGIINIYPGDPEQADLQAEYLIERWASLVG